MGDTCIPISIPLNQSETDYTGEPNKDINRHKTWNVVFLFSIYKPDL